jgi:type IV pilus assembly protein PilW
MTRIRGRHTFTGFSLVELLVALTIGSVLIGGAVYVYSQSRRSFAVSDTVARLQENGRFVLSVIEPDLQLAGYYGFTNSPNNFKFISGGATTSGTSAYKMQTTSPDAVKDLDATAHACGNNFAVDLIATVQGSNADYPFSDDCPALAGGVLEDTDTLTIRRSSGPPADGKGAPTAGRLQLFVNRLSPTNQYVFADGTPPSSPALAEDQVQVRDLVVRTYYISKNSTEPDAEGVPALRVKALADGPTFDGADVEVMRGVEDLQVQFGVDTGDFDGDDKIDPGLDENGDDIPDVANGTGTRYVNSDQLIPGFQVVSVRVWILLRAEQPEVGFVNRQTYKYADRELDVNDGFRRVLLSRTIQLRNSRVL